MNMSRLHAAPYVTVRMSGFLVGMKCGPQGRQGMSLRRDRYLKEIDRRFVSEHFGPRNER